ncbi:MAG: ATP-binding protein [Acidobacteriota bacterium]|mgnify:CR=1 FL=1|jgi:DNA replication protein DnaC|nr:ATP-binding protein [Acidobacteriota bacterium]OQB57381.1 MAG: transposase [Candidatus Aminicenantes bacterium ADurb.Bin147]HNQ80700.1 ATP-binding protein [Candidatus Aminicenantes bacterium]MDD8010050.1 ATP-binding protein [Acidobacteriota bacterium]MDD8028291.1 ATP-binding protein [Acidobacteriota bacterium]
MTGGVLIASDLPFSKREGIFKDPMVTAAAVDRLVHHSVILGLNNRSHQRPLSALINIYAKQ